MLNNYIETIYHKKYNIKIYIFVSINKLSKEKKKRKGNIIISANVILTTSINNIQSFQTQEKA